MATVYIDGEAHEVDDGKNLLDVCLSLGLDLPYFCWHPAMGSVGACRQCAVKQYRDENDDQGRLVMACMTPAADGTRISLADSEAAEFRESVIEWLMINHPHDCPVCDEGGECHLQDMTVMTGHTYRRYRFNKRTHVNQYLGPFINHEMNRCIQCYRCVRYYRDFADGRDFDVFGAHDNVYFGRHEDGVLENEFSGNLVEICPTGVFTDKTLKEHYTRKWDLQTAPSVCTLCSVGCNTIPGARYGMLRRIRNRFNREVNGYFICDRGRYGYEFVNSARRIRYPQLRQAQAQRAEAQAANSGRSIAAQTTELQTSGPQTSGPQALIPIQDIRHPEEDAAARRFLVEALQRGRLIGIGSPRASLESNFALRALVGPDNFSIGIGRHEQQLLQAALEMLRDGPARSPSLHDIEQADAIFVLGEDLTNTAPMLAFAVRQAARNRPHHEASDLGIPLWNDYAIREVVQDKKGPVFLATVGTTKLEEIATAAIHAAPQDIARLGMGVAHALDQAAPQVPGLSQEQQELAETIAAALRQAQRPVIISGTGSGDLAVMQAAANVAWALQQAGVEAALSLALPEANSMGMALLGGMSLEEVEEHIRQAGEEATVIIVENDLYRRAEPAFVDGLLNAAGRVVVLDHTETPTTAAADLVLPAATFAESDGTLVNQEGRAQRFLQVFVPQAEAPQPGVRRGAAPDSPVQESWRWLQGMMVLGGREQAGAWQELDDVLAALAGALPELAPVATVTPPSEFRLVEQKVPRQPHRYSGRTAMNAHINVSEPKPPEDVDAPMSFTMEGYKGQAPPALLPRYWAPGWNSVQALNKFQSEVGGPLQGGDPGQRLIEPAAAGNLRYFGEAPRAFEPQTDRWLLVPLYHIFGSEELSILTPGVEELAPQPYLALSAEDAGRLGMAEGDAMTVEVGQMALRLPVRIVPGMATGIAGLPVGLPGLPHLALPAWGRMASAEGKEQ